MRPRHRQPVLCGVQQDEPGGPSARGDRIRDAAEILEFLDAEQVRAAPRAIAEVLGVDSRTLAAHIGADTPKDGAVPIISSGTELLMRLTAWKADRNRSD